MPETIRPTAAYRRPNATAKPPEPSQWLPGPARDVEPFFEDGKRYILTTVRHGWRRYVVGTYRHGDKRPYFYAGNNWFVDPEDVHWYMPWDAIGDPPGGDADRVTLE